ncbi:NlpC/P60 family protein [Bdellovibrio reynosensis]|uniref:NlpC/P60 domain-containing protein n=1 Tax=Bdellovibrio reynosensis TaxID=2835041 RepID=A0ABY4CIB3_9BACT|nr:hypothetical protein [Bdellovibrio reynosensis]UOF01960.1 hypothetical protein MNR06_03205 [Bdellovibrio reynosensis]
MRKHTLTIALGMMITACAPAGFEVANDIASQTVQDIACKDKAMESKLWDGLKTYLLEQKSLPEADTFKQAMTEQVEKLASSNPQFGSNDQAKLEGELHTLVDTLLSEAPEGERVKTSEELLMLLSAIDVGDRTTVFRSYMQDKVRGNFNSLQKTVQALDLNCEETANDPAVTSPIADEPEENLIPQDTNKDYEYHKAQALSAGSNLAVFGGRWAMATAYQTCQTMQLPAMNDQTPDVQGISVIGKHSDGVGNKRSIASLSKVQTSHYYIRDVSNYGEGCFNVRQNPLIYDYGGKPYATTATTSAIDLFKNNGDGTSVLGIDCSGYVFSAMATAGLRLKAGRTLKASDSWAWGSSSYVEPQQNGLTCLNKISVTAANTMKAGDIVAVYGHVVLIDKVGADPFGINKITRESDCSKLTSADFDFVVAQSSPSKGAIGLNYFDARNYLPTSSKMKTGLEKYAYYTCLSKFNGKTYTPNVGTLSVVRHKGTADCVAPRVKMARESCIQSCDSLNR